MVELKPTGTFGSKGAPPGESGEPAGQEVAPTPSSAILPSTAWWQNPWLVTIIGTIVAGIILALILGT